MIFGGEFYRKSLVFGGVILLLLTILAPVYAGFVFSEPTSIKNKTTETTMVENRDPFDEESFLDKYDSSDLVEHYRGNSYFNRHDQHNPIKKPTIIDGEEWELIVPDDYSSIQEAIDHSGIGYRILIRKGIYHENIEIKTKSILLHGEDKENTIIDGGGKNNVVTISSSADGINISGFNLRNSGISNTGIYISSHYNIIRDTKIEANGDGIHLYRSGGNTIETNQIKNNHKNGIYAYRSNANTIHDNTINENDDNGIILTYSSQGTTLYENTISSNTNCGILLEQSSLGNIITRNHIANNEWGVKCFDTSDQNIFHHNSYLENIQNAYDSSMNLWDDGSSGNYWDDYTGIDSDNDGIGDTPYIIPGGTNQDNYPLMTIYSMDEGPLSKIPVNISNKIDQQKDETKLVDTGKYNWDIIVPDDYPRIQDAIDHAADGNHILVRCGIYDENIVIDKTSLVLHGEDNTCVIIDGNNAPQHIVTITTPNVEVSGFTICNCDLEYAGVSIYAGNNILKENIITRCGIGYRLFAHHDNTVTQNTITANKIGIAIWGSTENQITDNTIHANSEDGIVILQESTVEIKRNQIKNNTFNGLTLIGCSHTLIEDNTITGNGWFGIQIFSSQYNTILDNDLYTNNEGISLYRSQNTLITDNIVTSHKTKGISLWHSRSNTINKNTITNEEYPFEIFLSNDNTVSQNTISNNKHGMRIFRSDNIKAEQNTVLSNHNDGIYLSFCTNNEISDNKISENHGAGLYLFRSITTYLLENEFIDDSVHIQGDSLDNWNTHTISGNTVNGKPIRYYKDKDGLTVPQDTSQVILANCQNFKIKGLTIENVDYGIELGFSSNNEITENTISNCQKDFNTWTFQVDLLKGSVPGNMILKGGALSCPAAIFLCYSSNYNTITNNKISETWCGIVAEKSYHNNMQKNEIEKNGDGIYLFFSDNNNISENTIYSGITSSIYSNGVNIHTDSDHNIIYKNNIFSNLNGVNLFLSSDYNTITQNTIWNNTNGIWVSLLFACWKNQFTYNNFIFNNRHAFDPCEDFWNDEKTGNYWDDYKGEDNDGDGIGDTPYEISGGKNQDSYPLMKAWAIENQHPYTPSIDGATSGKAGIEYDYTCIAQDPDEDYVFYSIDWGDNQVEEWIGPYQSGEEVTLSHAWRGNGIYLIQLKVKDIYGAKSPVETLEVSITGDSPNPPSIRGPHSGKPETVYEYSFVSTDPNNDDIFYYVEWGDGQVEEWFGPFTSGETINASHEWNDRGTYIIRAKTKDINGSESDWGSLEITIPKIKSDSYSLNNGLKIILAHFPFLQDFLHRSWFNFDWHPAKEPYDIGG